MDRNWTPEPWAASHAWGWINHKDGARAAICVNALAGIEDPAAALEAVRDARPLLEECGRILLQEGFIDTHSRLETADRIAKLCVKLSPLEAV
jgi:hypothetical protein